jgi:hypothetical protein
MCLLNRSRFSAKHRSLQSTTGLLQRMILLRQMGNRITILVLCLTFLGCAGTNMEPAREELHVIVVRIPPFPNPNYSPLQNYLLFQRFLFPPSQQNDLTPIEEFTGDALPHDDSLIHLTLSTDGQILINNVPRADAAAATKVLTEVFENRTRLGVFEPYSDRIVKAVGIKVPPSAKYSDLLRMARIAKSSGAEPIILLLDGHLPKQIVSIP